HPHDWRASKVSDVGKVSDRIVVRLSTERGRDHVRSNPGDDERVAVRLSSRDLCRRGHTTCTAAIFDIDLLTEAMGESLRKHPTEQIGAPPGGKGDDELDRPRGPTIRLASARSGHAKPDRQHGPRYQQP